MSKQADYRWLVPVRVSVAPVQTYTKTIEIMAPSRAAAAEIIRNGSAKNDVLGDAIRKPGWKAVDGKRLGSTRPDQTTYDTYLDEAALDAWVQEGA